jgi:predicted RNase H-related nuclease YkuK (DUF458 family)
MWKKTMTTKLNEDILKHEAYKSGKVYQPPHIRKRMDWEALTAFISEQTPETKIYIGGDSERHKVGGVWYADYTVCVVVHVNGNRGCRVFGEIVREVDYDQKKDKPRMRLMNEVYKIADLYLKVAPIIGDRHCEVHLDINPNFEWASSIVIDEACGYIKAMCNVVPMVKPDSPAATYCADRFAEIQQRNGEARHFEKTMSAAKLKRRRKYA